jgi:hypothetical protein
MPRTGRTISGSAFRFRGASSTTLSVAVRA